MMKERAFSISPDIIPEKDVWFAMGYRDSVPEPRIRDMVNEVKDLLVPKAVLKYMYGEFEAEKISPREMLVAGKRFRPEGIICSYLQGMTHALVFVATAGREYDAAVKEMNAQGDIVQDFIADAIGTVLAEYAVSAIEEDYEGKYGISLPYSPGYCDWDIREQQILFSLFPVNPCGIVLSDSSLMSPEKSVSGFYALGETLVKQPYHCEICRNPGCYKRRTA